MGTAGAGKTTIGRALADALGLRFVDADDLHSPENKARMQRGEPLTDADRAPWLAAVRDVIAAQLADPGRGWTSGRGAVVACSALKKSYRVALVPEHAARGSVRFVYLRVPRAVLHARLEARRDHFAPPALLESQLATLEEPDASENAVVVDGAQASEVVVTAIKHSLLPSLNTPMTSI